MTRKIIMTDGTQTVDIYKVKSYSPFTDETIGAWSPENSDVKRQARSNRLVPSVFAGISARAQAMADMPFSIYDKKSDKEVDNSDNYKNKLGFLPNPSALFALSESSLVNTGSAYFYKSRGVKTGAVRDLQYWSPSSVTLSRERAKNREIYFNRTGTEKLFPADDVLYTWLLDSDVELGAPTVYPLLSAMTAAEASGAVTGWVRDYMKRGAVKAMMLMVEGMPPPNEQERIENWFNKFMSGVRGLTWRVFNASGIKPTIVGDGLESLQGLSINKELRYEIHQALGTRHLLEDENFATANAREMQFYTNTVMPNARLIQNSWNTQMLHGMGYHLEFEPERLEIFQVNESEQVKAFGDLFNIFKDVFDIETAFQLTSEKLDYQFTNEQKKIIINGINNKKKENKPVEIKPESKEPALEKQERLTPTQKRVLVELDKWEDKSTKAGKVVTWHAVDLPANMVKAIKAGELSFEKAREQINVSSSFPTQSEAALVLEGIRLALNNE